MPAQAEMDRTLHVRLDLMEICVSCKLRRFATDTIALGDDQGVAAYGDALAWQSAVAQSSPVQDVVAGKSRCVKHNHCSLTGIEKQPVRQSDSMFPMCCGKSRVHRLQLA